MIDIREVEDECGQLQRELRSFKDQTSELKREIDNLHHNFKRDFLKKDQQLLESVQQHSMMSDKLKHAEYEESVFARKLQRSESAEGERREQTAKESRDPPVQSAVLDRTHQEAKDMLRRIEVAMNEAEDLVLLRKRELEESRTLAKSQEEGRIREDANIEFLQTHE